MPEQLLASGDWYKLLAELVDSIGSDEFCLRLADALESATGYNSTLILAFPANGRPCLVYSDLLEADHPPITGSYFDGAYLLDPFYTHYREGHTGVFRLADIAPEDFFKSEYYRTFYSDTRLEDETSLLLQPTPDIHIQLSLGLRDITNKPRRTKIQRLETSFPMIEALARQHWTKDVPRAAVLGPGDAHGEFGTTLDAAFSRFGTEYLTSRECEIVHLILKGYSSKSIAQLLGISVDTVKVHRKRFHAKLDVSSQAELFSLFLESIALVPMGSTEDPLTYYYNSQGVTPAAGEE